MRSRNIKPDFYRNYKLAKCHPQARILYPGLWCIADRDGRLTNDPERIKDHIMPFDEVDVTEILDALEGSGFIRRYRVGKERFIWIPKFLTHQSPHHTEKASVIPPCPTENKRKTPTPVTHGELPEVTVQDGEYPPDSLIPDSLIPDLKIGGKAVNRPKDVTEAITYFLEIESTKQEAEKFFDHFESNGWKQGGRATMKNWKAAARNWKRNSQRFGGSSGTPQVARVARRPDALPSVSQVKP